jgi:hypothetical protein
MKRWRRLRTHPPPQQNSSGCLSHRPQIPVPPASCMQQPQHRCPSTPRGLRSSGWPTRATAALDRGITGPKGALSAPVGRVWKRCGAQGTTVPLLFLASRSAQVLERHKVPFECTGGCHGSVLCVWGHMRCWNGTFGSLPRTNVAVTNTNSPTQHMARTKDANGCKSCCATLRSFNWCSVLQSHRCTTCTHGVESLAVRRVYAAMTALPFTCDMMCLHGWHGCTLHVNAPAIDNGAAMLRRPAWRKRQQACGWPTALFICCKNKLPKPCVI